MIASGKVKEEARLLNKLRGKELEKYLDDLLLYFKDVKTGTGGSFKYLEQITSSRIFCQEEQMSCAAACIRQLAKDNGIDITEEAVRILANTNGFGNGTDLMNTGYAMRKIFTGKDKQAGSALLDDLYNIEIKEILFQNQKPLIATLMPQLKNASSEMDDTSKKNIFELIQAGLYFIDQNRFTLNEIAKKLVNDLS